MTDSARQWSEGALRAAWAVSDAYGPDSTANHLAEIISRKTGDLALRADNERLRKALETIVGIDSDIGYDADPGDMWCGLLECSKLAQNALDGKDAI